MSERAATSSGSSSNGGPGGGGAGRASRGQLVAWAMYDWANSAHAAVIQTFLFAAYFARQVAPTEAQGQSLWGYAIGGAGVLVALGGPILGAIADQGGRRKPWLATFTTLAVIAIACLWFVEPTTDALLLALVLVGITTLTSEYANIFYNAMLPGLAGPARVGRWSGWAWGLGYAGGVVCLVVALYGFVETGGSWLGLSRDDAQHVRATFVLVAVWYAVFALPLLLVTPDVKGTGKPWGRAARDGLRQLGQSIREVRRYKHIVRFLIARMVYIDGLATLFAFGGIYAAGTFNMTERQVLQFGIALNVTAGLGAAAFAWIDDWLGGKRTIQLALLGLILPGATILFVESTLWFWVLGLTLGLFVGPAQAAGRSFMSRVAPEELQNQMFGLYALSGKATAFAGPLAVAGLTEAFDSQRVGMSAIIVMFALGFLLMFMVPTDRPGRG